VYALNILRTASGLAAVQQTIGEALETEVHAALADLQLELDEAHELGQMAMEEIGIDPHGAKPGQ
jgi:hypothetical protein